MSQVYTELTGKETKGEKLVYQILFSALPEDFHIWHNLVIPKADKEVDFIILHPTFGLWILEVKDWVVEQIVEADTKNCMIIKNNRRINFPNPIWQARNNFIAIKELLQKEKRLIHNNGKHEGKLIIPIHHLAILSNITEEDISEKKLDDIFPENKIITSNYLMSDFLAQDEWQKLLLNKRNIRFLVDEDFAKKRFDLIKSKINPSTKILSINTKDIIGTLDSYQEKLIKNDLEKQIIIEGPAGSGKSIILFKRALQIKKSHPDWKVLLICFNKMMANYLKTLSILDQDIKDQSEEVGQIEIFDIYDWANNVGLRNVMKYYSYNVKPEEALEKAFDETEGTVEAKYDAVLVDEGHDSREIYIKIYKSMLAVDKAAFTFCYDKKQIIYSGCDFINDNLVDYLNDKGFQIDQKEKRLVNQYRTAPFLLKIGIAFRERYLGFNWNDRELKQLFSGTLDKIFNFFRNRDYSYNVIGKIHLNHLNSINEMILNISKTIKEKIKKSNYSWSDFLIIYPSKDLLDLKTVKSENVINLLSDLFMKSELEFTLINSNNSRIVDLGEDKIKIMTMHCSKGYDAKEVFIIGFDNLENNSKFDFPSNLGYVGITRAREECHIYYSVRNKSIKILEEVTQKFDPNFYPVTNLPEKFNISWPKSGDEKVMELEIN